ncbi:HAD family hydrolase [Flavobacteriaceae bacterium 3-367]
MRYKVLCSDLDGTLLSTKNDVSDFTVSQISRIKGTMMILLVSARMPRSMTYLQRRMGIEHEPIICYNGALILEGGKELASTEMNVDHVMEIHRMAEKYAISLGLYHRNEWYVEDNTTRVRKEIHHTQAMPLFRPTSDTLKDWGQRNIGAHKIMLMGTKETANGIFPELQERFGTVIQPYRSNDTLIEITPKSVSKLAAIQTLIKGRYSLEDVIAFGDNYNDSEMLQQVGCGVAVGNAREEVKRIADHITLENTEHGVAQFIEQHINI